MKKIILTAAIMSFTGVANAGSMGMSPYSGSNMEMQGSHQMKKSGHMAKMFKMADVNSDKKVTREEFSDMASKRFDKMDRNKDGVLSKGDRRNQGRQDR